MDDKKEVQARIVDKDEEKKRRKEEFVGILRQVSPGTHLRTGLENIVKAQKGAIIVVWNDQIGQIIDGGFKINSKFTAQKLLELSKMDGAIILSKDMKKILYANVHLAPDSKIHSEETGTRHKSGERTAKMTGTLAVVVSERKKDITLFYDRIRYSLRNTDELLRKTNEQIQILERHRDSFDKSIERLNESEIRNYPNIVKAISAIQKGKLIEKISNDLKKHMIELGNEGTILRTRLKELIAGVEKETNLLIKDYTKLDVKKSRVLLDSLSYDEIVDSENILRVLAYEELSIPSSIKGWRILSKTSLKESEIADIVKEMSSLGKALNSGVRTYKEILGEEKANIFREEIEKIKLNM